MNISKAVCKQTEKKIKHNIPIAILHEYLPFSGNENLFQLAEKKSWKSTTMRWKNKYMHVIPVVEF